LSSSPTPPLKSSPVGACGAAPPDARQRSFRNTAQLRGLRTTRTLGPPRR
jgi:hypothetical protein